MKKILLLTSIMVVALTAGATNRGKLFSRNKTTKTAATAPARATGSDAVYTDVSRQYQAGRISADSVVNLALYHKAVNPATAERCLALVADKNARAAMELGVLYAFSPEYAARAKDGVKLLQAAAAAGYTEANEYLGLYYFTHNDYTKTLASFEACPTLQHGFSDTALGSMYIMGKGVKESPAKAREYYHKGALKGYPRGMALYGFNMRASAAGNISYPESFFWLYVAGDLGDDAARAELGLPGRNEQRGDSEVARDAATALQFITAAHSGKKIQNEPIYKEGFLPGLKDKERAAENGDDWARFYLGSMNYNGDFLNQNYTQVLHYYEPIARNAKLPATVLATVNERLAKMYREGHGVKADAAKAARYARAAAGYGSREAYKTVENVK